jgi:hypothetical protein
MKSGLVLLSLAAFSPLWLPYGSFIPSSPGNPNYQPYVGQPGSTYDSQANAPQTMGSVSYNPLAPVPTVTPSTPSGSANSMSTP